MVARTIILKNTTGAKITVTGKDIPALGQADFSTYDVYRFRLAAGLETLIDNGDVVVNDGVGDLSADAGKSYVFNDIGRDTYAPGNILVLPSGITADRPVSPVEGTVFRNTQTDGIDVYTNGTWQTIAVFGTWYKLAKAASVTTTTQVNWIQKLRLTTDSIPAGDYRISWRFQWNHDAAGSDFESRLQLDDTTDVYIQKQEPKDSRSNDSLFSDNGYNTPLPGEIDVGGGQYQFSTTGSAQRFIQEGFEVVTLTPGIHTFDLDFRTDDTTDPSSIWDVSLEFWRVR